MHTFAPVCATKLEFDWPDVKSLCWVEIARYLNRLKNMSNNRWPKKVFKWDMSLKTEGWANQVSQVLAYANIDVALNDETPVDLEVLRVRLLRLNRNNWLLETHDKPKLRTHVEIYNEEQSKALVMANLARNHRSLIAKLRLGIPPLALEVGCWKDRPLE